MGAWIKKGLIAVGVVLLVIQFLPNGRDHTNPQVTAEPQWDSAVTRELAVAACFDCHSNETAWPWYSNIVPISLTIQHEVREGREELNFSEWHPGQEGDESAETLRDGSMPPPQYLLLHPGARLDSEQLAALEAGLAATFGDEGSSGGVDGARDDDSGS